MKHIAIIGAGWLGLPLAKHLQSLGYQSVPAVLRSKVSTNSNSTT